MSYSPRNANGQATKANSAPVVLASDQDALPITDNNSSITIDASSLPLPTGASTAAKQPALGTAGTASSDVLSVQGIASMTALKVDGSAVTQPVSLASVPSHAVTNAGTFAVQATEADGANTTLGSKADAKSTATDTTAITAMSVLKQISASVQAPPSQAVTNAGTFAAQADLVKVNGTTTDTNSGVKSAGTLRVVLATDQPALTNKILVTPDSVALPANQSVNVAQINGVATTMGNGTSGTGVQRVTIASDSTANVATIGTSVTPGTAATNLGKAEDAAHTTGDVGVMDLGVRNDTLADQTNANADYGAKAVDAKGRVMTAGAPRGLKGTFQVQISASTSETTILAATAATFHDVYGLILANTGATTTKVSIRDDTAGTVRMIIEVPTLETRGFMLPVDSAIPQTAVNKNWTAQCGSSTAALEVTGLYVSMV